MGGDGPIGRVHDLYFDDRGWTVRYLAVDLAPGLARRRILVSLISMLAIDMSRRRITTGAHPGSGRGQSRERATGLAPARD